jgi:hypothetical protein
LYFRRSRGHAAASDADNPTGLTEKEKEEVEHQEEDNDNDSPNSTTATPKISTIIMSSYNYTEIVSVDDGEVMLVENTPPRPPPLPEPPPLITGFDHRIDYYNIYWYMYFGNNDIVYNIGQSKFQEDCKDSTLHVDDRYGYSTTTIDGELILLF